MRTASGLCGNFVIDDGEACDDGNNAAGDGCSAQCQYEDSCACATGALFLCENIQSATNASVEYTKCCRTRTHPITNASQCDCRGENALPAWPTPMAYIDTETCQVRDVDECADKNAHCAPLAECLNLDGSVVSLDEFEAAGRSSARIGFECACASPLMGDGYESCVAQQFIAEAILEVSNASDSNPFFLSVEDAVRSVEEFLQNTSSSVSDAVANATSAQVSAYYVHDVRSAHVVSQGATRALQQSSGTNVMVFVFQSSDWDMLQQLTTDLNTDNLAAFLQQQTQNLNVFSVLQSVTAVVDDLSSSYADAVASSPGMTVDDIKLVSQTGEPALWQIDVHVFQPEGVSLLFFLRPSQEGKGVMDEPCVKQPDACCLTQFPESDTVSNAFRGAVEAFIAPWCTAGGALTTAGAAKSVNELLALMTPEDAGNVWAADLMDQAVSSHVYENSPRHFEFRLSYEDIVTTFATPSKVTQNSTAYSFDLGVLFYGAVDMESARMFTAVSWTSVEVNVASSLSFAFASEQSFSFLKSVESIAIEVVLPPPEGSDAAAQQLQYLHVSFRIPDTLLSPHIPGSSIQWAMGTSSNDLQDPNLLQWTNACVSADDPAAQDGSGLWDEQNTDGTRAKLEQLNGLSCAQQWAHLSWCGVVGNTGSAADSLYYIDIPLGDDVVPPVSDTVTHYLFLRFVVEAERADAPLGYENFHVLSPLSLQMQLDSSRTIRLCDGLQQSSIRNTDFVRASLSMGVDLQNINSAAFISSNNVNVIDSSVAYQAVSVIDSIMSLALQGSPAFFDQVIHSTYSVRLDHVMIVHLRDEQKHENMLNLTRNGLAMQEYTDAKGFKGLRPTAAFEDMCNEEAVSVGESRDCVIRTVFKQGLPTTDGVVHEVVADTDDNLLWLLLFFGDSEYMRELAYDFTVRTRTTFTLNPRYRRVWWISPAYAWPGLQASDIQDSALVFASFSVPH